MKKYIKNLVIILLGLVIYSCLTTFAYGLSSEITNGLDYLGNTQNADGSWAVSVTSRTNSFYSTYETSISLALINPQLGLHIAGFDYVITDPVDNTIYLSKKILALKTIGGDYSTVLSDLLQNQREDGGFGGDEEFFSDILNNSLALQALKAVNYSDQTIINDAISYLTSNQNSDGGFGFYSDDDSNIYMTAVISSTLQQFPQITSIATATSKATTYLISQQNADGGFGSSTSSESPSTVYETALAVIALLNTGQGTALPLQNAIIYLETTQLPNGSWNDDPYSTALALRALASVKPNLSISSSDIFFSKTNPTIGDTITVSANIKNTGPAQ